VLKKRGEKEHLETEEVRRKEVTEDMLWEKKRRKRKGNECRKRGEM
jgi:hypothetical protein